MKKETSKYSKTFLLPKYSIVQNQYGIDISITTLSYSIWHRDMTELKNYVNIKLNTHRMKNYLIYTSWAQIWRQIMRYASWWPCLGLLFWYPFNVMIGYQDGSLSNNHHSNMPHAVTIRRPVAAHRDHWRQSSHENRAHQWRKYLIYRK